MDHDGHCQPELNCTGYPGLQKGSLCLKRTESRGLNQEVMMNSSAGSIKYTAPID
jgi:hypothetical protein